LLAAELGTAITGHPQLGHQAFAVAAFDRIDARLLAVGKLDAQQPRVLTQLQRTEEIIDPRCGCNNLIHCSCLLLRPPTLGGTWTKETVGRLGQAFVPPIASDDSRLQGALPILDSCSAAKNIIAWQGTPHAWFAQTSRYQLARSQRSLSHPVNDAC